ncbi:MAG: hypothetical protein F6K00_07675 [Leptolyngbya sp. SIOISBB]|nr:hypothetical protein [Leptolyngbya sp. SIOISBB]
MLTAIPQLLKMTYRILHCGKSLENYYLCIQHQVAGFLSRGANPGETVYLAVKVNRKTYCGVRAKLGEVTDFKPWPDGDSYVHCLKLTDIEFCEPFEMKVLAEIGGKYWSLKYMQMAKPIIDEEVWELLDKTFNSLRQSELYRFDGVDISTEQDQHEVESEEIEVEDDALLEVPDAEIKIMGTFQTVSFLNETDKIRGLEKLANKNFYSLFPQYPESKTLLIPDNRMFITEGIQSEEQEFITGIRTIPDALLIIYRGKTDIPFQINLIEYECYGEQKKRALEKSTYLNGHIIPQLMKFASSFSVVTDRQIRERTAKRWAQKIIDYIYNDESAQRKITNWMRELHPDLREQRVALEIQESLLQAFRTNLQVMLVIDELSAEQKSTISNVVKAFKLENGSNIAFIGYVVRLEQKIQMVDGSAEYALSVQ